MEIILRMINMRVRAWPFVQHGFEMYNAVIAAKDLVNRTQPDIWRLNNQTGYQRAPEDTRARAFMRFLASEISPPAILANIRDADKKKIKAADGWLDIPDDVTLWLVDGQHRVRGLQMLLESSDKQNDIEIPVVIMLGQSIYQEAKQFVIINRTQKRVRTDLGERFLQKAVKEEGMINFASKGLMRGIEWVPTAIGVVDILNKDEHSIWYNKIKLPNEPKGTTIVSQKSFTDSLKRLVNPPDGELVGKSETVIADIISRYWEAIRELCPIPFDDPSSHVIQRTTGVFVLHAILPRVLRKIGKDEPVKKDFLQVIEKIGSLKNTEKWLQDGEFGRMLGQKGFGLLTAQFLGELEAAYQEVKSR